MGVVIVVYMRCMEAWFVRLVFSTQLDMPDNTVDCLVECSVRPVAMVTHWTSIQGCKDVWLSCAWLVRVCVCVCVSLCVCVCGLCVCVCGLCVASDAPVKVLRRRCEG
jgi:hypothetical protein